MIVAALALLSEYTRARCGYLLPPPQTPVQPLKKKRKKRTSPSQEEEKLDSQGDRVEGRSLEDAVDGDKDEDGRNDEESVQVQCARALLEQEATYNLGRAMHQLSLGFLAVQW